MDAVVITGSNSGIGKALVEEFRRSGFFTIGIDKDDSAIANANIRIDLSRITSSDKSREDLHKQIIGVLGDRSLKALINNAALQILGNIETISINDFKQTIAVNLTAPFVLSKALFPILKKEKGSIVNIGSIHARLTKPNFIAYATSKAALLGMTQAMAVDFGQFVRVNIIQPAAISTEMLVGGFKNNPEGLKQLEDFHPSGFIGTPEDVAKLAVFLSKDESRFINGSSIDMDGAIGVRLHDPD